MRGQAKITLALVIDGISDKAGMAGAKDDGKLRTASLIDRRQRAARQAADRLSPRRKAPSPRSIVQTALAALAAFAEPQGPDTLKALDAVASFMADWKAPKGPLALGLKPAKTAGLADLDKIMMPDALTDRVRLHRHLSRHQGTARPRPARRPPNKMKRRALLAGGLLLPALRRRFS